MITLTIPDQDITSGSIPISWCLDHESIKELMDKGNTNPTVLVVVAPHEGYHIKKENRYVCALSDLMTYISFRRSGLNRIHVILFNDNVAYVKDNYLAKSRGEYITTVLKGSDPLVSWYENNYIQTSIDVDVPSNVFAKEPSEWEKNWVLWLVKDKGLDQCDFRRKRLFAYTIQLFIFLVNFLIRLLMTLLSASFLLRGFSFKYVIHPLSTEFSDSIELFSKPSILLVKSDRESAISKDPLKFSNYIKDIWFAFKTHFSIVFTPFMTCFIIWLIYALGTETLVFLLMIFTIIPAVIFISLLGCWSYCKIKNNQPILLEPLKDKEEIDWLICNPDNTKSSFVKVSSLPSKKRTVKLRYQQVKSKICRPFSG
jgi:hypothetical protein